MLEQLLEIAVEHTLQQTQAALVVVESVRVLQAVVVLLFCNPRLSHLLIANEK